MASMEAKEIYLFRAFSVQLLQAIWITTRISSWYSLPLLGGQPSRLTKSFVE